MSEKILCLLLLAHRKPESKRQVLHFLSPEKMVGSQKWGYIRIIIGTILGGTLGFYVMHRVEISYKVPPFSLVFFFSCFLGIQTRLYVMVLFFFFYFLGFSRAQEKMNERLKEFESKMKKTEKLEEFEDSS